MVPLCVAITGTKTSGQLKTTIGGLGIKGLPAKPDFTNPASVNIAASMDDSVETKRKLEKLVDMPAVDMTMTDSGTGVGDLDNDDDDEEPQKHHVHTLLHCSPPWTRLQERPKGGCRSF